MHFKTLMLTKLKKTLSSHFLFWLIYFFNMIFTIVYNIKLLLNG